MRALDRPENVRLGELQRIKLLATLVLMSCFAAMVAAKLLETSYPWLAVVVAFAEAATIGGIADWYAVVALFKRPLNLPFPHTAIIPNNQHRIADNLGRFFETNFLSRDQIDRKLREIEFADEMANWLSSPERSRNLARFIARFIPQIISSIDEKGLIRFANARLSGQLAETNIAPLVGKVMQSITKDGRHQALLNELLEVLHRFLDDPETLTVIRAKVQKELPVLFNVWRADGLVLNRLVSATYSLLEEIKGDPEHPIRAEFETFLNDYIRRTRRTKAFAKRVENIKQQILARPELADIAENVWTNMRTALLNDIAAPDSQLVARMSDLFVDIGTSLKSEPRLSRDINAGMVLLLRNVIVEQRSNIAAYVAEQVRSWDIRQLVTLIELNVGRDLQFIRFNGMIIGGCVGLCLYAIERLLLS